MKVVHLFLSLFLITLSITSYSQPSNILVIGDSNGALDDGWVEQLKQLNPADSIYNTSISGNTIGFNNLDRPSLNTLKNVDRYLTETQTRLGSVDKILIMLGTNDCKAVFNDRLKEVPKNYQLLIDQVKNHAAYKASTSEIYIISPPPYASDDQLKEKYHGGAEDIDWLYPRFKKLAKKENCIFIDTYPMLRANWSNLSEDGIHMTPEGQKLVAEMISGQIQRKSPGN